MPFILPYKLSAKFVVSRFRDLQVDGSSSRDFVLQKRRRTWRDGKKLDYRIVTKEKVDGYRTKVAVGMELEDFKKNEWKYITEELPKLIPLHLSPRERTLWLIAHFTSKALSERGSLRNQDKSDGEEDLLSPRPALPLERKLLGSDHSEPEDEFEARPIGRATHNHDSDADAEIGTPAIHTRSLSYDEARSALSRPDRRGTNHAATTSNASDTGTDGNASDAVLSAPSGRCGPRRTGSNTSFLTDERSTFHDDEVKRAENDLLHFNGLEAGQVSPMIDSRSIQADRLPPDAALPASVVASVGSATLISTSTQQIRDGQSQVRHQQMSSPSTTNTTNSNTNINSTTSLQQQHVPQAFLYRSPLDELLVRYTWKAQLGLYIFVSIVILTHDTSTLLLWWNALALVTYLLHLRPLSEENASRKASQAASAKSSLAARRRAAGSSRKLTRRKKTQAAPSGINVTPVVIPSSSTSTSATGPSSSVSDGTTNSGVKVQCSPTSSSDTNPVLIPETINEVQASGGSDVSEEKKQRPFEDDGEHTDSIGDAEDDDRHHLPTIETGSTLRRSDEHVMNSYHNLDATEVKCRIGPDYARNGKKDFSLPSLYKLETVDLYQCSSKVSHIGRFLKFPWARRDEISRYGIPATFVVNCKIPDYSPSYFGRATDGVGWNIVFVFTLTDESREELSSPDGPSSASLRLLKDFVNAEPDSPLRKRFKGIARLVNIDEVDLPRIAKKLVASNNGKPFMIITSFDAFEGTDGDGNGAYFEVDVDLHRFGYISLTGLDALKSRVKELVFDFCFVLQGETDEELPERILGGAVLSKLNVTECPTLGDEYTDVAHEAEEMEM